MKNKTFTFRLAVGAVISLLTLGIAPTASAAGDSLRATSGEIGLDAPTAIAVDSIDGSDDAADTSGFTVVNLDTGEHFNVSQLIEPPARPAKGSRSPDLIDTPTAYSACFGVGTPQFPDFPLRSYMWVPQATGTVYLQCGPKDTKTYGWHHIQANHQSQWETRKQAAGFTMAWDDLMEVSTRAVLDAEGPRYTVEYGGKRCYTAPVALINPQGVIVLEFNPTVIVSMTNNRIITSIPTSTQDCGRRAAWSY